MSTDASPPVGVEARHPYPDKPSFTFKAFGFALTIIVGIGAIAVAFSSLGLHQGWWSAGALTNLSHVHLMIAVGVGVGGGIAALAIGIAGCVKNYQNGRRPAPFTFTQTSCAQEAMPVP